MAIEIAESESPTTIIEDGFDRLPTLPGITVRNVEELYSRHKAVEHLRRAICRLQPTLRNVIEIHQSNDSSVRETAELAGISVGSTKSRLLRARKILHRALN